MADRYLAPGSMAAYDALALAYARSLLAEAAFDEDATTELAARADAAWLAVEKAARVVDENAPKGPALRDWVERRLHHYGDLFGAIGAAIALGDSDEAAA